MNAPVFPNKTLNQQILDQTPQIPILNILMN